MFKKSLSLTVIICFFLTSLGPLPKAHADTVLGLPAPGTMVSLSPAYQPVMIKGLTVHKDNPFLFDFIVDVGQDKMSGQPLKQEGEKLIKYFLATLAIPDRDRWVNLSPYEKDRMIPEALGQTDMGRDLLAQDYILKQITASLIYPEKQLGKTFWDKVYSKAQQTYGTTQIPVNTFNKVWIMADKAEVFEHNQTAFVVNQHLKVMLEEDYLALTKNQMPTRGHVPEGAVSPSTLPSELGLNVQTSQGNPSPALASQIVRAIILPELEKEVNTGKNFANLRQIFNSVILSTWYKKNLKEALLNQVYADQSKVKGINLNDPTVKQQIYEQYLKAYQKGVFNYIKEDINASGETLPRKYFSGGLQARVDLAMTDSTQKLANSLNDNGMVSMTTLASAEGTNPNAVERTGKLYSSIHQLAAASQSVLGQWLTITTKTRKFRMEVLQINEDTSGGKSYTYLEGLLENGDPMKVMGDDFKSAKVDAAMAAGANGIQPQEGVLVFDTMAESSRSEEAAFILPGIKIKEERIYKLKVVRTSFHFRPMGALLM